MFFVFKPLSLNLLMLKIGIIYDKYANTIATDVLAVSIEMYPIVWHWDIVASDIWAADTMT